LVVTKLATGRRASRFTFAAGDFTHPTECMRWAGSRFLQPMGDGLLLVDAETGEVSRPLAEPECIVASSGCHFSADLAWVVFRREYRGDLGLYCGRVVLPAGRGETRAASQQPAAQSPRRPWWRFWG
jgi:hypothetical protein